MKPVPLELEVRMTFDPALLEALETLKAMADKASAKIRDRAQRSALNAENGEWMALAEDCARYCAQFLPEFTTEDVWMEIDERSRYITDGGGVAPTIHEPRALGVVIRRLSQQGLIVRTGKNWKGNR